MYYPSSENKGADQLRGYREADLRLCFRLCRLLVFQCMRRLKFEKYYVHVFAMFSKKSLGGGGGGGGVIYKLLLSQNPHKALYEYFPGNLHLVFCFVCHVCFLSLFQGYIYKRTVRCCNSCCSILAHLSH